MREREREITHLGAVLGLAGLQEEEGAGAASRGGPAAAVESHWCVARLWNGLGGGLRPPGPDLSRGPLFQPGHLQAESP